LLLRDRALVVDSVSFGYAFALLTVSGWVPDFEPVKFPAPP